MNKRVLVTGANGFVGSHIVDALLRNGYKVKAMVRASSDLTWLEEKPVELVVGTLHDKSALRNAVKGVDAVIHNAGVVSASNKYYYYRYNTEGTQNLVEAILDVNPKIERFVYVSSQAAGGPTSGNKLKIESDLSNPVTDYGKSKLLTESILKRYYNKLPITIIRPPSVYGPRDTAFLPMFKMIIKGLQPTFGRGRLVSMIHVQDLARQVVLQMEHKAAIGEVFYASPFDPVSFETLGEVIGGVVSSDAKLLRLPDAFLKYVYPLLFPLIKVLGIKPPFGRDKLPEFLQERWTISGGKAEELLGFEGKLSLQQGIGQTAEWYRWKNWIKTSRDKIKEKGLDKISLRPSNGKMRRFDNSCDLCALAFNGELKTKKHYADDEFIIVDCLICRVPMAVLKEHKAGFSEEQKEKLINIFHELFGDNAHPDFEQRRIPEHAHVHYRNTLHAPPWVRRPEES